MGFETFDKRQAPRTKQALVTIQRGGTTFSFNRAAYDLLDQPEAVELLYDREQELIGFKKTSLENPRGFPLRTQGQNSVSFMVAAQAFTKYYGIDATTARRFAVHRDDDIVVLDLNGDSADATGHRLGTSRQDDEG